MPTVRLHLEVVDISSVEGLCPKCLLPSLAKVTLGIRNDPDRPVPSSLVSRVACNDCGWVVE